MGACYLIVNPAKREYLDPGRFGEAGKVSGLLRGEWCLHALKLLIDDSQPKSPDAFDGAWLGDPVVLASDDSGLPDPGGVPTTSTPGDPRRNLHAVALAEFTDVSYRALARLAASPSADELVLASTASGRLALELCTVADRLGLPRLQKALEKAHCAPFHKVFARLQTEHMRPAGR